jgi:hypothetical protein
VTTRPVTSDTQPGEPGSGAIFYAKRRGKNPTVCWFPAVIMAWFVKKGARGEMF